MGAFMNDEIKKITSKLDIVASELEKKKTRSCFSVRFYKRPLRKKSGYSRGYNKNPQTV